MAAEHEVFMAFAREILKRSMAEEDVNDIHTWASEQLARLGGATDADGLLYWLASFDFYESLLDKRATDAATPANERKALLWPWPSWNRLIDPLAPGMLAVIAAGDGMGKTTYSEMIAEEWAKQRNRVVFVHYELNHAVMMDRRYARHTNMTARQLRGSLTPQERMAIAGVHDKLRAWEGNITYQHAAGWTMERTIARLRQLKADNLCDAVIIDYLEKNASSRRQIQLYGSNGFQREADNVEQLKTFAESTDTPVVMLAQMSKAGKTANFDDLDRTGMRGAGEKSEKANAVILLHRERSEDDGGYSPIVNVRVDKNTMGATGAFKQMMKPEYFRVHDMMEAE